MYTFRIERFTRLTHVNSSWTRQR